MEQGKLITADYQKFPADELNNLTQNANLRGYIETLFNKLKNKFKELIDALNVRWNL